MFAIRFEGYEAIVEYLHIEEKADIEVHGQKVEKEKRHCLFCGRNAPEVKFSKIAHAVSESIGNKSLFSHFECNQCNEAFGELFEDSLGKYLLPFKIISQIYGKKNRLIAKDKPHDEQISFGTYQIQLNKNVPVFEDISAKGLIIENPSADILTMTDEGFKLNIPRQHYIPELVYCAFLKMAYSLLPLELYTNYVKKFVEIHQLSLKDSECFNAEEKEQYIKNLPNCGVFSFASGINPYDGVNVYLLQRKNNNMNHPLLLFYIQMGNFSFAIPVLSDNEIGNFKMPNFTVNKNEQYSILDLKTEEPNFVCYFSAKKMEIQNKLQVENVLRKHNLLKSEDNI
ncbi:MAG TPA: HNH endonuclease [Ruminococcus flavefaciens]|nr:HNH endonuclease [Ruminococcus flavefaciens]